MAILESRVLSILGTWGSFPNAETKYPREKPCRTKNIFWLMIWKMYSHAASSWFEKGYCAAWLGSHGAEVWGEKAAESSLESGNTAISAPTQLTFSSPRPQPTWDGTFKFSKHLPSSILEMPSQMCPVGDSRSSQVGLKSDRYRRQGPHLSAPSLSTCSLILNDNGFIPSCRYWILGCCPIL